VIASIGSWGQTVGAQWLFVNDPNAATIVPLVQTASTLPMMLLALPAGVLADAFDRRWMMFVIEVYFITVSTLLAVLTALGMMPPALLLTFTFAVGAGQAMLSPTWQAMITELVPRSEFAAATRLDMVSVNGSPSGRSGDRRVRHRRLGRPASLRAQRGHRLCLGSHLARLASADNPSRPTGAIPPGAAVGRPLCPARAGRPDHLAALRDLHLPRRSGLGAAPADREPAVRTRRQWLRNPVRRALGTQAVAAPIWGLVDRGADKVEHLGHYPSTSPPHDHRGIFSPSGTSSVDWW